tara:strand:+ start:156 stop:632 length:477 start_codon:yes stop_codon:yes gene_type:complete
MIGYPSFFISEDGEIYSLARKNGLYKRKQCFSRDGYRKIRLTYKGGTLRVHREVLKAFDRLPKKHELCRHLDGNPTNNNIKNLKWGTPKENAQDCLRHGRNVFSRHGEDSPVCKYTDKEIADVRQMKQDGATHKEIVEKYKMSKAHVSYIVNRKTRTQ